MPPQINATLSRVQAPGVGEAVDGPPAPGPEKWAGSAAVYVREQRKRRRDATHRPTGDVYLERTIIADTGDPAVDWRVGDVVTFAYPTGSTPQTGVVDLVNRPSIDDPGIPADLKTTRITLQAA